jgi:lysophospholipase L1-like esterase
MNTLATINLDMLQPGYITVHAVQDDKLSRQITANLLSGGTAWTIPSGALMTIRYSKQDGTAGYYDSLENGGTAYTVASSRQAVTITLVQQALSVAGNVNVQLAFYNSSGAQLSSFSFRVDVEAAVYTDESIVSSDYFNVLTATMTQIAQDMAAWRAGYGAPLTATTAAGMTDQTKIYVYTGTTSGTMVNGHWYYYNGSSWVSGGVYNSTAFETDPTLTISGAAADAKATGDQVSDLKSAISGLQTYPEYTWAIGRNISSTGVYQNNTYTALSRAVPADPGDIIFRDSPAKDSSNYNLIMYINAFMGATWKSRTQISEGEAYVVPSGTDNIRIGFGRASSSGVAMTQEAVDQYFAVTTYSYATIVKQIFTLSGTSFAANTRLGISVIGAYSTTPFSSMNDSPTDAAQFGGGFFANIPCGSFQYNRMQILYDITKRQMYTRYLSYNTSDNSYTVGDWRTFDFSLDVIKILAIPSNAARLSDVTGIGHYRLGSYAQTPVSTFITNNDFPLARYGGGLLTVRPCGGSNGVEQVLHDVTTGDTWSRYISGSSLTTVGDWNAGKGIKWAAIGDSITYGVYSTGSDTTAVNQDKCYVRRVANAINAQRFTNLGVRGLGYVHAGNNSETLKDSVIDVTAWSDYNLVTVALGINDYFGVSNIGGESSTAWDGTVYGNIKGTIESIMSANPAIKLVFITPFNMSKYGDASTHWGKGYSRNHIGTLNEVKNAIVYWCEYYGIEYINETDYSPINDLNITSMLLDGLHPSWTAHEQIAHELIKKIPFA